MTAVPNPPSRFIGCDVGKASVVVFDSQTARTSTVANTPEALSALMATLDDACLVVCESTGGYEAALLTAALADGRAAHRADARKVKHFIRSRGTLGKTDAIDARALAQYGRERHAELRHWQAPDIHRDRLQTFVLTRRDLVAQRLACKNRLAAPGADPVRPRIEAVLACLTVQIEAIEHDMQALIESHQTLAQAAKALRGIAGFGPVITAALLGLMPELGQLDRRKIAALAGLAPHPNQSGATDRYRSVRGGRHEVKSTLFMAALVATRHNTTLKAFYAKLIANNKTPLVALTAVMRKLIVIANALVRNATVTQNTHLQVS
jgi:transposase